MRLTLISKSYMKLVNNFASSTKSQLNFMRLMQLNRSSMKMQMASFGGTGDSSSCNKSDKVITTVEKATRIHALKEIVGYELIKKWTQIQEELRHRIIQTDTEEWQSDPDFKGLEYIGGLDISYPITSSEDEEDLDRQNNNTAYAALIVCSYPSLELVYKKIQVIHYDVPYVPGFLAFRECEPCLNLINDLFDTHSQYKPNVLLVDGNGLLHPQQSGLACHIGYNINIPTIGASKNIYLIEGVEFDKKTGQNLPNVGDFVHLKSPTGEIIGMALKSSPDAKNPIYISIGHKISLETCRRLILACSKYRIPEPIRKADFLSREFMREHLKQQQATTKS